MANETDRLVLEALRGLREEFQGVRAQVTSLHATVGSVAQDVGELRSRMDTIAEKTSDGFHQLREELIEEIHALRDETRESLRVVKIEMGEVREDVRDVRLATVKNGSAIEHLDESVGMLRESTMTGLGFATQINQQQKKLTKRLEELAQRVERLENSK